MRTWLVLGIGLPSLIIANAFAQSAGVLPELPKTIAATGNCIDEDSLDVADVEDGQVRFACLQNKGVQQKCGLDGRNARLNAFRQWMANLDAYQQQCEQRHGTFSYQSDSFQEHKDETFCSNAFIDVSYGRFENPICNFVSRCPSVPVVCTIADNDRGFRVPTLAVQMPGVPIPIPITHSSGQ